MSDYLVDEVKALKLALENEIKSHEFYKEAEKKSQNDLGKKTFAFLAKQELGHITKIKKFITELNENFTHIDIQMESEKDFFEKSKTFFEHTIKHFAQKLKADSSDLKAYKVAMEIERSGHDFYKKAYEKAKTKNIKAFFKFLMEQEQLHYQLLENTYSYMKNPEGFFLDQENWNFEGA